MEDWAGGEVREQNVVHLGQRLDALRADIRSLRTLVLGLHTPVVLAILGATVKYLSFQ